MLTAEMNAVFEKNMDLWNRFFGMMDKQPDMNMSYEPAVTSSFGMSLSISSSSRRMVSMSC